MLTLRPNKTKHITALVIGAGQAGLAMSRCLSDHAIDHVVLEKGEVANAWAHQRWDSLRLLTPNWQSRLPGYSYSGDNPEGFMTMPEITTYLRGYAAECSAPIETGTEVRRISADGSAYRVETNRGTWRADRVILATGACARPVVPAMAKDVPATIDQLTPFDYKNPGQLKEGGVLIVGASATGVQLAAEIRKAGHDVLLATGEHIRMPRTYRGRDIQWWMDHAGTHDTTTLEVDDLDRARRVPSLQLIGSHDYDILDLNTLQDMGIEVAGRLAGIRSGEALFSGSLRNHCTLSDLKMNRLLKEFDAWAARTPIAPESAPHRFAPTALAAPPRLTCDLEGGRFSTILWATGFRPDFSYLDLPVFDHKGRLDHNRGIVAPQRTPGLYVLGLPFQRKRKSALIDGVGDDAADLALHIAHRTHSKKGCAEVA